MSGKPATPQQEDALWRQEIRFAVSMVGGVSLAIWMGGVTSEISRLLHASRALEKNGRVTIPAYAKLLELLNVRVSVDVLTGTSAGGINSACLGLAEAYDATLDSLRDTWLETGSMANLLRDPAERQPRSLLDGDRVLLGGLNTALDAIARSGQPPQDPDITVMLTSTMIDGETARFDDALGNLVRDGEHRLLFRFAGPDWNDPAMVRPLALAARSTASFPGAFELSLMPSGSDVDAWHPDMSRYTTAARSHWLTDGGVLLNKPLRPALREIFERPAEEAVRRLLLYVVPTSASETTEIPVDPAEPPLLGSALGHVVSAVTSQTVSSELEELTRHNDAVVRARGTRVSLAAMATRLTASTGSNRLVDQRLMKDYLDRHVREDAAELVREATRQLDRRDATAGKQPGQQWGSGMSGALRKAALTGLLDGLPTTTPAESCAAEQLAQFRTGAVEGAVSTGLQLVNAGFRLRPNADQVARLNHARTWLHTARKWAARPQRLSDWLAERPLPAEGATLAEWIEALGREWAGMVAQERLVEAWRIISGVIRAISPTMRVVASTNGSEREDAIHTISTLLNWLNPPPAPYAELPEPVRSWPLSWDQEADSSVAGRMLALHIATLGLLAESPSVDQRVDLVQVSADTRTLLDMSRQLAKDKLTGVQVHNFGAFYKASWRANDWMWGRIDGVGWLLQSLLDPQRLRLLQREDIVRTFREIGWEPPRSGDRLSAPAVKGLLGQLADELDFLGLDVNLGHTEPSGTAIPASMPVTAMVLARSLQTDIAAQELTKVAETAADDIANGGNGKWSREFRKLLSTPAQSRDVQREFQTCAISGETFDSERGSTLLTKTVIQAGAVGINAAAASGAVPRPVKPAIDFAQASGRSAWWVTSGASTLPAPFALLAGAITMVAGLVLSSQANGALQVAGLPLAAGALAFLVLSLIHLRRTWRALLTLAVVLAGAALLFAGFVPVIRENLFAWLGAAADNWQQGKHPWWWLVVAALLILPAVTTPFGGLWRGFKQRLERRRPQHR
ncbi:MAG: patatin-like protein [Haloechinothrix sp.]